jgi:hypothetical protein
MRNAVFPRGRASCHRRHRHRAGAEFGLRPGGVLTHARGIGIVRHQQKIVRTGFRGDPERKEKSTAAARFVSLSFCWSLKSEALGEGKLATRL